MAPASAAAEATLAEVPGVDTALLGVAVVQAVAAPGAGTVSAEVVAQAGGAPGVDTVSAGVAQVEVEAAPDTGQAALEEGAAYVHN